ncbi:MAG TPA: M1 family metallopeptidase, partial [Acidobacteriota bacterium]
YEESGWDEQEYSGIGDVSYFDPSDFQVRITAPANYKVVTTGSIVKRIPSKQGKIVLYSQSKMTRDFEVELSARFEELTRIQNRVIVRSFFLPEHAESGKRVLDSAVQALEYYEKNFGPYPYTELDVVEAPLYGGAGGVEFPGIVTISSMLYRDVTPDAQDDLLKKLIADNPTFDQLIEFVVAHEVAHQWWNAVVGSNSKQFPFIDEAMANFSAILYFEHYYGRQAAENQMALQMKVNYQLHRLLGGSDQPVQQPASSFKGALEYSAIVYGKGALYFDHLRSLIGDAAFFAVMRKYYDSYWFRIAGPDDFRIIAQKQAPPKRRQIEQLHQRWLKERHGDEDIGPGTLDAVFRTVLGAQSQVPPPDLDKLLKGLDDLLKQQ